MQRRLGPILALQGAQDAVWRVSILVVFDAADTPPDAWIRPSDTAVTTAVPAGRSDRFEAPGGRTRLVVLYPLALDRTDAEREIAYGLSGQDRATWSFTVPPADGADLRMAYVSCNGFSHAKTARDVDDKFERWRHMRDRHDAAPLHVLLMGGDQVYGDPIWERVEALRRWAERDGADKWSKPYTEARARGTRRFYLDLYESRWSEPAVAEMLARVPSLMMWDDHDIFDGWGSYPERRTESPIYQGIFGEAARHFDTFQLQNRPGAKGRCAVCSGANRTYAVAIGSVVVLALDTRTERGPRQVISPDAWQEIYDWLDTNLDGATHLLVMSSVPVVHLDFAALERGLSLIPGQQSLEDDVRDHWLSRPHRQERLRLIHRLFGYARDAGVRVSIVSGDIHVAGMGVLEDRRDPTLSAEATTITQLISSPVVHPTPPAMLLYAYNALNFLQGEQEVDQGLVSRMMKLPASDDDFIGQRNWLELEVEPSATGRIWASWHAEGQDDEGPYTAVVHKIGR